MPDFLVIFVLFYNKSKYFILFSKLYYYVTPFALFFGRYPVTFFQGWIRRDTRKNFQSHVSWRSNYCYSDAFIDQCRYWCGNESGNVVSL